MNEITGLMEKEINGKLCSTDWSAFEIAKKMELVSIEKGPEDILATSRAAKERTAQILHDLASVFSVAAADSSVGAVESEDAKDVLTVFSSSVNIMVQVQAVISQSIVNLERSRKDVDLVERTVADVERLIGNVVKDLVAARSNEKAADISAVNVLECFGGFLEVAKKALVVRSGCTSLVMACQKSGATLAVLQCQPVRILGTSATTPMNGIYVPTIRKRGGKPEFCRAGGAFTLYYNDVLDDKQGWCISKLHADEYEIMSDSDVELPHLMAATRLTWTGSSTQKDFSGTMSIQLAQSKMNFLSFGINNLKDSALAKIQEARDVVISAASDVLSESYSKSEATFGKIKEDLSNEVEGLEDIQMEVTDLLAPFKPLTDIAQGIASIGWYLMKQSAAQNEMFRVRAVCFYNAGQLKTCLVSAQAARARGISKPPRLDVQSVVRAVDDLIVKACDTLMLLNSTKNCPVAAG